MPYRVAQLLIATDQLLSWLRDGSPGFVPCRHHLPDDAICLGAHTPAPGLIGLVFVSEQFPEHYPADGTVESLAELPQLTPIDMRPRHYFDIPLSLN